MTGEIGLNLFYQESVRVHQMRWQLSWATASYGVN